VGLPAIAGGTAPAPWNAQLNGVATSAPRPLPPNKPVAGPGGTVVRGMTDLRSADCSVAGSMRSSPCEIDPENGTALPVFELIGTIVVVPAMGKAVVPE